MLIGLASGHEAALALVVAHGLHFLESHAGQLAVRVLEGLRHEVIEDRNALVLGVFLFPGRRFHFLEARAHDDFHVLAAETLRRPAAVHGGIAASQHDHAFADLVGVAEGNGRQPVDADMDVLCRFLAPRNIEIAPARRPRADEDRVIALLDQLFHAVDFHTALEFDAEIQDVAHLFVDHFHRQAEARNLRPDHSARARVLIEYGNLVAERRKVARDGERRRPGADARDLPAVFLRGGLWHLSLHVALVVGSDALQAADRHRFRLLAVVFLDAAAPAGRLARAVAGAAENSRKNVGVPVDHVGVVVTPCGDQPDVFGDWCMGRTGPLAIYDFVKILGRTDISRFQNSFPPCQGCLFSFRSAQRP